MKRVAEDAGVSRESLYRVLSANGNPELGSAQGIGFAQHRADCET